MRPRSAAYRRAVSVAALGLCFALPRFAAAQELLTNGGFETGNLSGWTVANRTLGTPYDPNVPATGTFLVDNNADTLTPLSGLSTLGPASGNFYALSDMTAQGTHALLQSFTVPLGATSVLLSFDMYVYDWYGAGAAMDPSGLDHTSGGTGAPNQHARVDLLSALAGSFDTSAGSVLSNFYLGVDPESAQNPPQAPFYRNYAFDLTGVALPGQTYQLRFGEVDNQFVIHQAVDNVSVRVALAPGQVIPEPGTWALLLAAAAAGVPLAGVRLGRSKAARH